jgi:dTDP-4-dehydrorhamnose reductase
VETIEEGFVYAQVGAHVKILITGSSGMLGTALIDQLLESKQFEVEGVAIHKHEHRGINFHHVDLTDKSLVHDVLSKSRPDLIIHTAAYTDVDACEKEGELAQKVNVDATRYVAEKASQTSCQFIFISTDYVFDGEKKSPYTEEDDAKPKSTYGQSKLDAEEVVKSCNLNAAIIRTSWLYGDNGKNFFRSIIQKIARNESLQIVDDQLGAPTYTQDLATAICRMIKTSQKGGGLSGCNVYHVANAGQTTWFGAARKLIEKTDFTGSVEAITSSELNRAAQRPMNSVLNMSKLNHDFGIKMRPWQTALDQYWSESLKREWEQLLTSN